MTVCSGGIPRYTGRYTVVNHMNVANSTPEAFHGWVVVRDTLGRADN